MPRSICDLKPGETARDALNLMAATVTESLNVAQLGGPLRVVYVPDHTDYTIAWSRKRSSAPPSYWPSFREVVTALCARLPTAAERQMLAATLMEQYFDLRTDPLPRNESDKAQNALRNLAQQSHATAILVANFRARTLSESAFRDAVSDISGEFLNIIKYLQYLGYGMQAMACIDKMKDLCNIIKTEISQSLSMARAAGVLKALVAVRATLDSIMLGYATVSNNLSIPSFVLLRLLVGFRVESGGKLEANIASAQLTALLASRQDWLFDIMEATIANIAKALSDAGLGDKISFFVKGGRGIAYLMGMPASGENDWDTQILIDPSLSPTEWWATYDAVQGVVNEQLLRSSFAFSANLMANAKTLIANTTSVAAASAKDAEAANTLVQQVFTLAWQDVLDEQALLGDPVFVMETVWQKLHPKPDANCKAELIDVGLPRYYTIELLEQWRHVRPTVLPRGGGIPVPAASYFIEELIALVRETDAGVSSSSVKRDKRLKRLLTLLTPGPGAEQLAGYLVCQAAVAEKHAPQTLRAIKAIQQLPIANLMTVLLAQFVAAYRLEADPNLAAAFDRYATRMLPKMPDAAAAVAIERQADLAFSWCMMVSRTMMRHLVDRGQLVLAQTEAIFGLLSAGVAGQPLIVPVLEDHFAICLYRLQSGPSIQNSVAPAAFAVARLLFQNCAGVLEISQKSATVVENIMKYIAGQGASSVFGAIDSTAGIKVFAKATIALDTESYAPLLITMVPAAAAQMATLIRPGSTLCGLGYLTAWCRERAADVSEWATRRTLSETFGALIEMEASPPPRRPQGKAAL